MEELLLIKPGLSLKEEVMKFTNEFYSNDEKIINGSCGLDRLETYEEWINYINRIEKGLVDKRVPSSVYFAKKDDRIIGVIDIRHILNEEYKHHGHIGLSIIKPERRKGFGLKLLELGLQKAREFGLKEVIISCEENNVGSRRLIEKTGGILSYTCLEDDEVILVYYIKL